MWNLGDGICALFVDFLEVVGVGAKGNVGGATRNWWRMVEWPPLPTLVAKFYEVRK